MILCCSCKLCCAGLAESYERLGRVLVVHITQRHDILALKLPEIALAHPADADTGDIEFPAGRDISRSSQNMPRYDCSRREFPPSASNRP